MSGEGVWGYAQTMSAEQIDAMPDELLVHAVRTTVEVMKRKAAEHGASPRGVSIMLIGEWIGPPPREEEP